MKTFDYLCILYIVALLAFGFSDDPPAQISQGPRIHYRIKAQTATYRHPAVAEQVPSTMNLSDPRLRLKPIARTR